VHTRVLVREHANEHVSWSTHLCVNMVFEIKHKKFCGMLQVLLCDNLQRIRPCKSKENKYDVVATDRRIIKKLKSELKK